MEGRPKEQSHTPPPPPAPGGTTVESGTHIVRDCEVYKGERDIATGGNEEVKQMWRGRGW